MKAEVAEQLNQEHLSKEGTQRRFAVSEIPDNSLYKLVSGRRGLYLANPNDVYIGRAMVRYGEFSELEWWALDRLTPPGCNVIEVGANIGVHTVSLAKKVGRRGLVYAFEPQPVIFQNLCANLALNGLTNVHAVNAGCSEENEEILFPPLNYATEFNFGGISLSTIAQDKGGQVRIPIVRLDDAYPVDALALIKIDAEGMETSILKGAERLVERFRPVPYVENDRRGKSEELISLVFEMDYRAWWHLPPLFNSKNFAQETEDIYERVVSVNMICIPNENEANMGRLREVNSADDFPLPT